MSKEKDSAKSTREKAAEARAAQQAAEKKRERTVRIVGAIGVIVVVALIIGLAIVVPRLNKSDSGGGSSALPTANPTHPLPTGVFPADAPLPYGVPVGTGTDAVPELAIWEDFQCPSCGSLEKLNGPGIQQLANDGKVRLVWRPTAFLDNNLKNTSSAAAINAFGCAIDQGKTEDYHNVLYANQPSEEGAGWTQEQLLGFGAQVGLTGSALDTFTSCLKANTYLGWAANSTQAFYDDNVQGTPYATLNGQPLDIKTLADQAALEKAVAAAAGGGSASPTGSPSPSAS